MNPVLQDLITYVPLCTMTLCQMSGAGPIYTIIKGRQTGDISAAPFITMIIGGIMWLYYGYLVDLMIFISSVIGLTCGILYFGLFLFYTSGELRKHYLEILSASFLVLSVLIAIPLIFAIDEHKYDTYFIGFECNILSIIQMSSPLATMRQVIKEKDSKSMSMIMAITIAVNNLVWIIYGFVIMDEDLFVIASSTFGIAAGFLQMTLICMYPQKHEEDYGLFA